MDPLRHSKEQWEDPLNWWKSKEIIYPHLSKVAKKYLCIPASSAPSERVFSSAGLVVSKKRAALRGDNVAALVFLKQNWSAIEELEKHEREENRNKRIKLSSSSSSSSSSSTSSSSHASQAINLIGRNDNANTSNTTAGTTPISALTTGAVSATASNPN